MVYGIGDQQYQIYHNDNIGYIWPNTDSVGNTIYRYYRFYIEFDTSKYFDTIFIIHININQLLKPLINGSTVGFELRQGWQKLV